jgi:hypothetical protein
MNGGTAGGGISSSLGNPAVFNHEDSIGEPLEQRAIVRRDHDRPPV